MPRPTFTQAEITERTIHRRAIEAVVWGMPAVNFDLMYKAAVRLKAEFNQIVYWSHLPDWKNQTLTPNADVIYLMPFFNTKDAGPVVLEIPAADDGSITGTIMDSWQAALEDVGPAGLDRGKGGKYLILPPTYKGKAPDGYIVLASDTYAGYALLRSNPKSGAEADVAKAVAYGQRIKLYPLSQAANPPTTKFVDAFGTLFDSVIAYDLSFFQSLDGVVQREPWLGRDRAMINQLKSIGIEKGKPFKPDAKTQEKLSAAAREAQAFLDLGYENAFKPPYYDSGRWALPVPHDVVEGLANFFATPDSYPIDARGFLFSMAFSSIKHLGTGQFYLVAIHDKEDRAFDGGATYRLTIPSNPPVRLYWSAVIYDRETHGFIRNQSRFSRSLNSPGLQKNPDGSVDLYFGPAAPTGKEPNWIPTSAGRQFEVMFRFYGPEKALFEKTWKLPDVEPISAVQTGIAA